MTWVCQSCSYWTNNPLRAADHMDRTNHDCLWSKVVRTKAQVLEAEIETLEQELKEKKDYLNGLKLTTCGLTCSGCGTYLESEYDFAAHFVIPDERYLNLGDCPL